VLIDIALLFKAHPRGYTDLTISKTTSKK